MFFFFKHTSINLIYRKWRLPKGLPPDQGVQGGLDPALLKIW